MKKILALLAAALLGSASAFAQINLDAGWQRSQIISTTIASDGYRSYTYAWFNGFYAGATSTYPLVVNGLSFDYSILYSYSTGTESDVFKMFADPHYEAAKNGQVITDEHYLTLPGTLNFRCAFTPGFAGYVFAGVEVSYCLSSKSYSTWPGLDGVNNWNVDHFDGETNYNGYRRFDLGLRGGLGFEFANLIRVEAGAGYGLLDRSKADDLLHRFYFYSGIALLFK